MTKPRIFSQLDEETYRALIVIAERDGDTIAMTVRKAIKLFVLINYHLLFAGNQLILRTAKGDEREIVIL